MRLIQQTPAWSLHAFIRILGVEYAAENSVAFKALGLQLPIVVDMNNAKTEALALNYLAKRFGNVTTEMSTEAVFSAYLRQSLVVPFAQLKRLCKTEEEELFRSLPVGLNFAVNIMSDIRDFFAGDRFDALPGATEQELMDYMQRVYEELNESLLNKIAEGRAPIFTLPHGSGSEDEEDELPYGRDIPVSSPNRLTPSSPGRRRPTKAGIPEAVLFGHLAEVLCRHERLGAVVTQYEGLLSFFQFMCVTYFKEPYDEAVASEQDSLNWKSSMDTLLCNRFLTTSGSKQVRQCLMYGTAIPCTKPSPSNELNRRVQAASDAYDDGIYPDTDAVNDDANPLAHHGLTTPTRSPGGRPASGTAAATAVGQNTHPVLDEPTSFGRVGLDLSLSTDWRRVYHSIGRVFGVKPPTSAPTPASASPEKRAADAGAAFDKHSDSSAETAVVARVPVHNVTLGGVLVLLGVGGCFAGYAYHSFRKKR